MSVVEPVEARCLMSGDLMAASTDPMIDASHTGGVNVMLGDGSVRFSSAHVVSWSWGVGQTDLSADPDEGGELR